MFAEILFGTTLAAIATCAGSLWIDKLYSRSTELSFPENISDRAKFRKPILFVSLAILFCAAQDWWQVAAIFLLALMTATDFEQYMLFDAMTLPLAIIGAAHAWQGATLTENLAAALIGGGIFFVLALASKGALGGGDVKLIAALGLWFDGEDLLNVVLAGTIAGGAAAVLMIATGKKQRNSYFAYGPYFALTAIYFLLTR